MLRFLVMTGLIVLILTQPQAGGSLSHQTGGVTAELTRLEHRIVKAWIEGDRATVDSILASDWSVIDLTGSVVTKAEVMKEFGSGERRIESGSVDDLKVRDLGNVAIVTGRSTLAGSYQGKSASVVQRFTDVFAKHEGRWQVVASQGTQVAQPAKQ